MFKVAQILASVGGFGGLEKHTKDLVEGLKENNVDVTLIIDKSLESKFQINKSVDIKTFDFSRNRYNPFALFQLYKMIKKEQFDIVHTQGNKATAMIKQIYPYCDFKFVATLHNEKKSISMFSSCDHVITPSDRIAEGIKKHTTIYHGIDVQYDSSFNLFEFLDLPIDSFIVSGIGRFVEAKNFQVLIRSFELLPKNFHLVLVGGGKLEGEYREIIKEKKITNVHLLPYMEYKKTMKIIKDSSLIVIPSLREGFSYVFAETLLLQKPLLATDVADISKFIPKKYLVKPLEQKIARKIIDVASNYEITMQDYQKSFKKAKREFSKDTMIEKTINVYTKVLSKG